MAELNAYQGQLEQAVNICKRIVTLDPMDENSYHDMGRLLIELNRLDEADDCYRHLLSINPAHRNAYGFLAKIYIARGDADRALEQVAKIREEFERRMGGKPYVPPIPENIDPPRFEPVED